MKSTETKTRCAAVVMTAIVVGVLGTTGCHSHRPLHPVCEITPLGSVVDEINQQQEEGAELAKFTVYMHEFEINAARIADGDAVPANEEPQQPPRGYRLTPSGQDHVRQIARQLQQMSASDSDQPPAIRVVVERSTTSKRADTVYQYPVHFNEELDAVRRQVVVTTLERLGVPWAEECVIVAPAFATGLSATESAAAYQRATGNAGQSSRSGLGSGLGSALNSANQGTYY